MEGVGNRTMNRLTVTDDSGQKWERVGKRTASKVFDAGKDVRLIGCKFNPFGAWGFGSTINIADHKGEDNNTLANYAMQYAWYNCNYETGYYPAFYVRKG